MKKVVSIVLIMATLCLLTGCSFVKAETTIQVSVDADGKTVKAVLKADQSQGYEWKYFITNGALSESASRFENNISVIHIFKSILIPIMYQREMKISLYLY